MNEGIYPILDEEIYHADGAISRSAIMKFLDCPQKYWSEYLSVNKRKAKSTAALEFGKAFHSLILEPVIFDKTYVCMPKKVLLKDVGKELYQKYKSVCQFIEENEDLIALDFEDFNSLVEMKEAIENHEEALGLIQDGQCETSFFWRDEHSGLMVKARPDILHENMIVDLKTVASASSKAFQYSMLDYGNHIQGAMIQDGIKVLMGKEINTVINICIEKTYPYAIGIKIIGEDALEYGRKKYKQALLDIKNCIDKNSFPSYDIEIINLPGWVKE